MHLATLEEKQTGSRYEEEQTPRRCNEGFRVYVGVESGGDETQLRSILDRSGATYSSLENIEELRDLLFSNTYCLAIFSVGFWGSGAKQLLETHLGPNRAVQFALWAGNRPVDIDCVVESIRLGAAAVIHGSLSEARLLQLIKELQAGMAELPSDSKSNTTRTNGIIASHENASTYTNGRRTASRESVSRRQERLESKSNPRIELNGATPLTGDHSTAPAVNGLRRNGNAEHGELAHFILGRSAAIQAIRERILNVASTRATVMVFGESGTGKELVARAVHHFSDRAEKAFVPVNMSAIPEGLAESLLFGHEKGAFTSAHERHQGWCQTAHGGTLFLDEIGDMELAVQPKLLRFLQEGTLQTIGAKSNSHVDVRLITATNRDPKLIVKEGRLREDLFFRLHVVPIFVPPLRERREDIVVLAEFFLRRAAERHGRKVVGFSAEAIHVLSRFNWPGNVRQLENAVERIVIFAEGEIAQAMEIPAEFHAPARLWNSHDNRLKDVAQNDNGLTSCANETLADDVVGRLTPFQLNERTAIIDALQRTSGHVVDAAKLLGLGQATMYRKIKQYDVPNERKRRKVMAK